MKNILFTYQNIYDINIGDYIQSLAAEQFLDKDQIEYINRDHLNLYQGEQAKVIMNGWFTYNPKLWLPNENISPLFISFHLNSEVKDKVLTPETILYLKKHSPIGCRDTYTMNVLKDKGIDAYYSGCLTTTLGYSYSINKKNNDIVIVDPYSYMPNGKGVYEIFKTICQSIVYLFPIVKLIKKYKKDNHFMINFSKIGIGRILLITKSYLLLKKILEKDLIWKARYITHYYMNSEYPDDAQRFDRAKELLNIYGSAKFVITSRIHSAFPSISLGTPVVYIKNLSDEQKSSCRLDDINNFFNVIEVKNEKVTSNSIKEKINNKTTFINKTFYLNLQKCLIDKCIAFINK